VSSQHRYVIVCGHIVEKCFSQVAFSQLLNVHGAKDVRQEEIHTAEPLVPEPSTFEVELAIEKLKTTNHQVLIKSQRN